MASRCRALGRVVGISDSRAYCLFASIGYGVALGVPLELLGPDVSVGFRFFVEMTVPAEANDLGSIYAYLFLDLSDFEFDHDQRVPSWDEIMAKQEPKS
jgi:hypothetical protein